MSNSQSYDAECPATRHYHDDWEDGDHCDSVNVERRRGAGDGIGMEEPPRPKLAVDDRREYRRLGGDDEGCFSDGATDFHGESREFHRRGGYSHGEDESVGASHGGGFDENGHGGDPRTFGKSAYYDDSWLDLRGDRRPEMRSRDAWGDESSSTENYGGTIRASENGHGVATGRSQVEGVTQGRSRARRQSDMNSYGNEGPGFCESDKVDSRVDGGRQAFGLDGKSTARRSPLRDRNGGEANGRYPIDNEGRSQDYDGSVDDRDSDGAADRSRWQLDNVRFDRIQDHREAHGECQRAEEQGAPPKEIYFLQGRDGATENDEERNFEPAPGDEDHHREDSSEGDGDSEIEETNHRRSAKSTTASNFHSPESLNVTRRIESVMESLLKHLNRKEEPILRGYVNRDLSDDEEESRVFVRAAKTNGDPKFYRSFGNIAQCRSFASICLVMSFVHQLLLSNRTTTTREVYYVFVTHFRNQRECDGIILDVAKILGVSRRSLGLSASPKGWFCGCFEITRKGALPSGKDVSGSIDGTALPSIQGLPITREWTERNESGCTEDGVEIRVSSKNAKVILVIEKEGVYNRLSEERIFDRYPCILVTGKGFPDLATRALVNALHVELDLPVVGLCDCNPYGVSVLALYHCAGDRMGIDGRRRYSVPIQWLGLRPSEVARLKDEMPETVFQKLTDLDNKRIASLLDPDNAFLTKEDEEEVREMEESGYKVELEAMYWLGPDFMGNWVVDMLKNGHACTT